MEGKKDLEKERDLEEKEKEEKLLPVLSPIFIFAEIEEKEK